MKTTRKDQTDPRVPDTEPLATRRHRSDIEYQGFNWTKLSMGPRTRNIRLAACNFAYISLQYGRDPSSIIDIGMSQVVVDKIISICDDPRFTTNILSVAEIIDMPYFRDYATLAEPSSAYTPDFATVRALLKRFLNSKIENSFAAVAIVDYEGRTLSCLKLYYDSLGWTFLTFNPLDMRSGNPRLFVSDSRSETIEFISTHLEVDNSTTSRTHGEVSLHVLVKPDISDSQTQDRKQLQEAIVPRSSQEMPNMFQRYLGHIAKHINTRPADAGPLQRYYTWDGGPTVKGRHSTAANLTSTRLYRQSLEEGNYQSSIQSTTSGPPSQTQTQTPERESPSRTQRTERELPSRTQRHEREPPSQTQRHRQPMMQIAISTPTPRTATSPRAEDANEQRQQGLSVSQQPRSILNEQSDNFLYTEHDETEKEFQDIQALAIAMQLAEEEAEWAEVYRFIGDNPSEASTSGQWPEVPEVPSTLEPASAASAPPAEAIDCGICMDSYQEHLITRLSGCQHSFCVDCLKGTVIADLTSRKFPILCPTCTAGGGSNDPSVIEEDTIRKIGIPNKEIEIYEEIQNSSVSIKLTCNRCKNTVFVDRDEYNSASIISCPVGCGHRWCKACQEKIDREAPPHSCNSGAELRTLSENEGWKECPGCKTLIEKTAGCNHMTCLVPGCNTHFCYRCGGEIIKSRKKEDVDYAVMFHDCATNQIPWNVIDEPFVPLTPYIPHEEENDTHHRLVDDYDFGWVQ